MSTTKQLAAILAIVFGFFLLIVIPPMLGSLLFPGRAGLAAVSAGISEAILESLVFLALVVVVWRIWIFARRRTRSST